MVPNYPDPIRLDALFKNLKFSTGQVNWGAHMLTQLFNSHDAYSSTGKMVTAPEGGVMDVRQDASKTSGC